MVYLFTIENKVMQPLFEIVTFTGYIGITNAKLVPCAEIFAKVARF